ncbi:MAG TPA: hypothetical protein VFR24_18700 [Candidatus Angelobacter sp.]|nr:hypothetical protein [Candidatus Angelobacter sp.]
MLPLFSSHAGSAVRNEFLVGVTVHIAPPPTSAHVFVELEDGHDPQNPLAGYEAD